MQQGEWVEASAYILGQLGEPTHVIRVLPKTSQSDVNAWAAADRGGMVDAVSDLLGEVPRMSYSDMDSFLSWCVRVVRALVNANQLESAERVAAVLFGTTAESTNSSRPAPSLSGSLCCLAVRARLWSVRCTRRSRGSSSRKGRATGLRSTPTPS